MTMKQSTTNYVLGLTAILALNTAVPTAFSQQPSTNTPIKHINPPSSKISPDLIHLLKDYKGKPLKAWVFLNDKGFPDKATEQAAVNNIATNYNQHAIARRIARGTNPQHPFDASDLPVASQYINAIQNAGGQIIIQSKWLNAVSVLATHESFNKIAQLPFVNRLQPVNRSTGINAKLLPIESHIEGGFYGNSETQLNQINLIALHQHGFTGKGIIIGILDTGFRTTHDVFNNPEKPLNIVAAWDFVNNDPIVGEEQGDDPDQHVHGTLILGTLAAYLPNSFVGSAYDASYILTKTEDITQEVQQEEDFYAAGLEFIEMNGGDVATSSLGYIDWYTQNDLDGQTAVTTIAVNAATDKGIFCCTAAGNSGHDGDPNTSHLIAPADAIKVFTAGAVASTGEIADFSSDGPTADGRTKPEILAQGVSTQTIWPYDDSSYAEASGTSLSTPLIAGAVSCLAQARPTWTVDQMRTHVLESGDYFKQNGSFDPQHIMGYGILNAFDAVNPLILDQIIPGIAGQNNTLHASGATTGELTYFIWGTQLGTADIPGCPGATVSIANPKIAGQATADATGQVTLDRFVPNAASGLLLELQALELTSCRISNIQEQTIQ